MLIVVVVGVVVAVVVVVVVVDRMGIMALIMPFGGGKNNCMETVARRNTKSMSACGQ